MPGKACASTGWPAECSAEKGGASIPRACPRSCNPCFHRRFASQLSRRLGRALQNSGWCGTGLFFALQERNVKADTVMQSNCVEVVLPLLSLPLAYVKCSLRCILHTLLFCRQKTAGSFFSHGRLGEGTSPYSILPSGLCVAEPAMAEPLSVAYFPCTEEQTQCLVETKILAFASKLRTKCSSFWWLAGFQLRLVTGSPSGVSRCSTKVMRYRGVPTQRGSRRIHGQA